MIPSTQSNEVQGEVGSNAPQPTNDQKTNKAVDTGLTDNVLGLVASFGSFQAYYEDELLKDYSPFAISSVGSLQSFLMVFLGCFAGPIFDLGYARQLIWAGPTLIVLGTVAQSFSTNLWQLLLAEGLCVGVGMGCLAVLGVAILSLWWSTKLPVANGIAAAGSGVGG